MVQAISLTTRNYAAPDFRTKVGQWRNVGVADSFVRSNKSADVVSFCARLPKTVTVGQVKKHFENDRIAHPIIDIIEKIKRQYPSLRKLDWIDDWMLGKVDYKNMAKLMNMQNGKYIRMWQSTTADGVPNMQKLAVFAKVLRTTDAMNDVLTLSANRCDLVVRSVCREKSPEAIEALVVYKARSKYINPYLTGKKMIPRAERRIDVLTEFLNSSATRKGTIIFRGDGCRGALNSRQTSYGKPAGDEMDKLIKRNASEAEILKFIRYELMGKSFIQERFLSATFDDDLAQHWAHNISHKIAGRKAGNSAVHWKIIAPVETRGAYIEPENVMYKSKQGEVLIQRNSSLRIINVKFDKETKTWILHARLLPNQLTR